MSHGQVTGAGEAAEVRLIQHCPVGCAGEMVETAIVLPEGRLRRCSVCGQLVSQITVGAFDRSMKEFDTPAGTLPTPCTQARHDVRAARLFEDVKKLVRTRSAEGVRLLDIGCSSGALLRSAQRAGLIVEGVEPAAQAAASAKSAGLNVFHGYLQDARYPAASFDAVTLMEVIEHLPDPRALLREVWRILKPNGVLVVGTGNSASWTVRLVGARWGYFQVAGHGGHISFFNPTSLGVLAERCGFRVERSKTRRVSLVEPHEAGWITYRMLKIAAEMMAVPARLFGTGHDMLTFLRKLPT